MKKLSVDKPLPSEPMPEQFKIQEKVIKEIPQLSWDDLEKLTLLKDKLKTMSVQQKEKELCDLMASVIDYLDEDIEKDKKQVVLFVMYKLERYLLRPKSGPTKLAMAVNILKPLFHNDENNTELFINAMMHEHKQVKTLGRVFLRAWRYFLRQG